MAAQVSWSEALMAMIAMMIVLAFVLFYYCIWPLYRGYMNRKERERELYENDPRWDNDKFNFTPRRPKDYMHDKKYSRMAACSRTSSMRSTAPIVPQEGSTSTTVCPPMYYDLFERDSSLGTPPSYKSHTSSLENSSSDLLSSTPPTVTVAPPVKPTKVKKGKKKCVQPPPETIPDAKE